MSKLRKRYIDIFASLVIASVIIFSYHADNPNKGNLNSLVNNNSLIKNQLFGFNLDSFYLQSNVIKKNDVFGTILSENGLTNNMIMLLEHEAKKIFNIRNIQVGAKYHIIKRSACDDRPVALVYEPDKYKYVVCDLRDSVTVNLVEKKC